MASTGIFKTTKKDGTPYYRASITYKGKHISLGSSTTEAEAIAFYENARDLLEHDYTLDQALSLNTSLSFKKVISILNFKNNGIYIKTPIYMYKKYFEYYLDSDTPLIFDIDDLFYYSTHSIQRRNGYLFVADYGNQINILSRYGIKNYAVINIDYRHANQNELDYTYDNIEVINHYYGVSKSIIKGKEIYKTKIHINGNIIVGRYENEAEAAIAYNKAVDTLNMLGINKNYEKNYIENMNKSEYIEKYKSVKISRKLLNISSK